MIQIKANGVLYNGFENITISRTMQSICDTFSFSMYNGDQVNINGNDFIQVLNNGRIVFSGFVDTYNLGIGDKKRPLICTGRSKSSDIVDCSIENIKQYNKQNPIQIISDMIKPFNLKVSTNLTLDTIPSFDIKVGETYFNAINRLCKQYNILPVSDNLGNIKLIKNNNKKAIKTLKDNDLKTIEFNQDFTSRFSEYTYKKESSTKDITDGKIKDDSIERFRPFVNVNTEDKTNVDMAKWKKNNDISNSIILTCSVNNWDYETNTLINIESEIVNNTFLVRDIIYEKGNNGLISNLTLVDKGLFNDS